MHTFLGEHCNDPAEPLLRCRFHDRVHYQAKESTRYSVMYYKNNNSIGIREKFGDKRQILSFGGAKIALKEDGLRGWADQVLGKLDEGQSIKTVKNWVKSMIA